MKKLSISRKITEYAFTYKIDVNPIFLMLGKTYVSNICTNDEKAQPILIDKKDLTTASSLLMMLRPSGGFAMEPVEK